MVTYSSQPLFRCSGHNSDFIVTYVREQQGWQRLVAENVWPFKKNVLYSNYILDNKSCRWTISEFTHHCYVTYHVHCTNSINSSSGGNDRNLISLHLSSAYSRSIFRTNPYHIWRFPSVRGFLMLWPLTTSKFNFTEIDHC